MLVLGVVAVAVFVGAATLWYFFFRPAGPPAIGTQAPVIPAAAVATATPSAAPALMTAPDSASISPIPSTEEIP
jgi:hypothetical protein